MIDALVCQEPGTLKLEKRAEPIAKPGEALVRVRRIGVCGTDYHIYEGTHPFLRYPRVMGHELAVEVVNASPASGLKPGQVCVVNPYLSCGVCVACRAGKPTCCVSISVLGVHQDGGMTDLLALPEKNLVAADGLTTDECATVEFLAIGAHAVRRGFVTERDRALVIGAGPIGLGAALFAKLSGARVSVMDIDSERLAAAKSLLGVGTILAGPEATNGVKAATNGEDFDIVFDATGNRNSMNTGFDFVAHGGRYVFVSVVKGPISFEDADFHRKELTLFGSRNATSIDFDRVIQAIRDKQVPVDRIITHRTSLAKAAENIPVWATQKHGLIKALVMLGD